jgi:hypothetical protein
VVVVDHYESQVKVLKAGRDEDIHGWWVNRIFRLLEWINNDDGIGMGDRVFPSCEVVERRDATEHFAT